MYCKVLPTLGKETPKQNRGCPASPQAARTSGGRGASAQPVPWPGGRGADPPARPRGPWEMLAKRCEQCSGYTWLIKPQLESAWVSPASLEKARGLQECPGGCLLRATAHREAQGMEAPACLHSSPAFRACSLRPLIYSSPPMFSVTGTNNLYK